MAVLDDPLIHSHDITFDGTDAPFNTSGGFGDIFLGYHSTTGRVAVKRLRLSPEPASDEEAIRRFRQEGDNWHRLNFKYLQPFLGFYYKNDRICLVSPFVENGSLPDYLARNPDANRQTLLHQTALAIAYLHDCGIVHGNIKGSSILVSHHHTALLAGFSLARPQYVPEAENMKGAGAIPWQSPELLVGHPTSFEGDVYAFGMTIYEALSGKTPFSDYTMLGPMIAAVIVHKERPTQPLIGPDNAKMNLWFWAVAERCWRHAPQGRPKASDVVDYLDPDREPMQLGPKDHYGPGFRLILSFFSRLSIHPMLPFLLILLFVSFLFGAVTIPYVRSLALA